MIVGIITLILIVYGIYKLYEKSKEYPPNPSSRYYDAFPGQYEKDAERYREYRRTHPIKKTKQEEEEEQRKKRLKEESHRQARAIVEEFERRQREALGPLFEEYDKDHFYDVTNRRWVKYEGDGIYIESYDWYEWDAKGRRDGYNEIDVGELITRKEYELHRDHYRWYNTKYEEDED